MNFDAFIKDIRDNQWNVHGVEIYQDGRLIHQYGDAARSKFPIYSAAKTVTSIAAGMAWDLGKIDLERTVLAYLPSETVCRMPEKQTAAFREITIRRLLTMSVGGFPFRPAGESFLNYSLSCTIPDARTKTFHYSNIPAYLVGVALTHALQEDLFQYLNRNLFAPLHITEPGYQRCPDGYFYGASGMELTVHDLSQIGLLLYHGGLYDGRRLLSEEYVKMASSIQQRNREGGYGFFLWKYRDGFRISGKWNQRCCILPEEKLVITYLSHIEEETCGLTESMEKHILSEQ